MTISNSGGAHLRLQGNKQKSLSLFREATAHDLLHLDKCLDQRMDEQCYWGIVGMVRYQINVRLIEHANKLIDNKGAGFTKFSVGQRNREPWVGKARAVR